MKTHFLFLFFLLPLYIFAQNKYDFDYDYSQFKADSTSNLIELYYKVSPANFVVKKEGGDSVISQNLIFRFFDDKSPQKEVIDTLHNMYSLSDLISENYYKSIIGIYKVVLREGNYSLSITIKDNYSDNFDVYTESIEVTPYNKAVPFLSDIELANSIKKDASGTSSFIKNTLSVTPNPTSSYSSDSPLLQYYLELYNISKSVVDLNTSIISDNSKIVYSKTKTIETKNESIVHVDQINLLRYPSGKYTLQVILADSSNNYAYSSQKQFYFYNKLYKNIPATEDKGKNLTSTFSFMSAEECDEVFNQSKYIATDDEIDQYEKITTLEGKREFLTQFWGKRSGNQNEDVNLAYIEYMKRIDEANKKFKGIKKLGYQTERGRIYLKYGVPSRVDRYPNESELKPYEIWYYDNLEGGVIFIFGDLTGFSEYELIHSTKRGEIYDDTWERRLYIY